MQKEFLEAWRDGAARAAASQLEVLLRRLSALLRRQVAQLCGLVESQESLEWRTLWSGVINAVAVESLVGAFCSGVFAREPSQIELLLPSLLEAATQTLHLSVESETARRQLLAKVETLFPGESTCCMAALLQLGSEFLRLGASALLSVARSLAIPHVAAAAAAAAGASLDEASQQGPPASEDEKRRSAKRRRVQQETSEAAVFVAESGEEAKLLSDAVSELLEAQSAVLECETQQQQRSEELTAVGASQEKSRADELLDEHRVLQALQRRRTGCLCRVEALALLAVVRSRPSEGGDSEKKENQKQVEPLRRLQCRAAAEAAARLLLLAVETPDSVAAASALLRREALAALHGIFGCHRRTRDTALQGEVVFAEALVLRVRPLLSQGGGVAEEELHCQDCRRPVEGCLLSFALRAMVHCPFEEAKAKTAAVASGFASNFWASEKAAREAVSAWRLPAEAFEEGVFRPLLLRRLAKILQPPLKTLRALAADEAKAEEHASLGAALATLRFSAEAVASRVPRRALAIVHEAEGCRSSTAKMLILLWRTQEALARLLLPEDGLRQSPPLRASAERALEEAAKTAQSLLAALDSEAASAALPVASQTLATIVEQAMQHSRFLQNQVAVALAEGAAELFWFCGNGGGRCSEEAARGVCVFLEGSLRGLEGSMQTQQRDTPPSVAHDAQQRLPEGEGSEMYGRKVATAAWSLCEALSARDSSALGSEEEQLRLLLVPVAFLKTLFLQTALAEHSSAEPLHTTLSLAAKEFSRTCEKQTPLRRLIERANLCASHEELDSPLVWVQALFLEVVLQRIQTQERQWLCSSDSEAKEKAVSEKKQSRRTEVAARVLRNCASKRGSFSVHGAASFSPRLQRQLSKLCTNLQTLLEALATAASEGRSAQEGTGGGVARLTSVSQCVLHTLALHWAPAMQALEFSCREKGRVSEQEQKQQQQAADSDHPAETGGTQDETPSAETLLAAQRPSAAFPMKESSTRLLTRSLVRALLGASERALAVKTSAAVAEAFAALSQAEETRESKNGERLSQQDPSLLLHRKTSRSFFAVCALNADSAAEGAEFEEELVSLCPAPSLQSWMNAS